MPEIRLIVCGVFLLGSIPAFGMSHSRRGPTAPHSYARRATKAAPHVAGQQGIDSSRTTEIQSALNRAGYLDGEPTGHWDAATSDAMHRYQSDNGWQTKLIPDSRAIIKLGLGPRSGGDATLSAAQ